MECVPALVNWMTRSTGKPFAFRDDIEVFEYIDILEWNILARGDHFGPVRLARRGDRGRH